VSRLALGVDVGGTRTKLGLVDGAGAVLAEATHPSVHGDGERFLARLASEADALLAGLGRDRSCLSGIGLAVPGFADPASGRIAQAWESLAFLERPGFAASVAAAVGATCTVLNDARAAGLGEARAGAGMGASRVLALTLGTGLGFAFLVDGAFRDPAPLDHMSGHIPIGHSDSGAPAATCCCGATGCLESAVRAEALVRASARVGGTRCASAEEVAAAAMRGEAAACAAVDGLIASLARGLDAYILLLAPDRVVLGGGVAHVLDDRFGNPLDRLRGRLTARPWPGYQVELVRSRLGSRAGVIGAALQACAA
jgi:glucokinase